MIKQSALYNDITVRDTVIKLEVSNLENDLGKNSNLSFIEPAVNLLQVAAQLSLTQLLSDESIDDFLRRSSSITQQQNELAQNSFQQWLTYLNSLSRLDNNLDIEELLSFSAVGFLAHRPTEVRHFLRLSQVKYFLNHQLEATYDDWKERVIKTITFALLVIIRQEDHNDIRLGGYLLQRLVADQKAYELDWLNTRSHPQRDAFSLLGLYHLSQALNRTAEYILSGSVETDGRRIRDFAPELRRLLVKSEEYISLSEDILLQQWLNITAIIIWFIRSNSIWTAGQGISERIDALLESLTQEGKHHPIFSLLPSQQEALRQNLLDPAKIAVVLQMPTSAGKTILAEFSIVQTIEAYKNARIIYIVPTRALVTQVRRTLIEDLRPLGIETSTVGSAFEEDPYELNLLNASEGIVVATPEKIDLLLRTHPLWFQDLRLVIVDEAHLLLDKSRGVKLELLIANIRREFAQARLLLLTPFVDNASEIARWLGDVRGMSIDITWRPARILIGLATISGTGKKRNLSITLSNPFHKQQDQLTLTIPTQVPNKEVASNLDKTVFLAEHFLRIGTVLAIFSQSRTLAEKAAKNIAKNQRVLTQELSSPALRLAIALARDEYGPNSTLAYCLERGVSFHHSALSPILRYLIEDQVRARKIKFIAATTTLAQGVNFPVATVIVHSISKPEGNGNLSPSEFWNIAGRAGRVGFTDKGCVIFVDKKHQKDLEFYASHLSEEIRSALLNILQQIQPLQSLRELYNSLDTLRPFIQYLAHAAAGTSPERALTQIEELLQASLANAQVQNVYQSRALRNIASRYLREISNRSSFYLKVADETGLGSFSFDDLYSSIRNSQLLLQGPKAVLEGEQTGIEELIKALQWIPELDLAIGKGEGQMDTLAVAKVVEGWMAGQSILELASHFPEKDEEKKIRKAATYIYSRVSQTISWGAHAYIKGWLMSRSSENLSSYELMLPAFIEYGVRTPEAAVASLFNIPRQFAEAFGEEYRFHYGPLHPNRTAHFKTFIESANPYIWDKVVRNSPLADKIDSRDLLRVWKQMQGFLE